MANQIIQLKDGNDNVFPECYKGTFTPKLYDNDSYVCDLPEAQYIRIGKFGVAFMFSHWGDVVQEHLSEINSMVQIRNIPFMPRGGTVYFNGETSANRHTLQMSTYRVYFRPVINKSSNFTLSIYDQLFIAGEFL